MADEPERRIVGAIHAELEKQETDGNLSYLSGLNNDGTVGVDGIIDLYMLARAILAEVEPPPAKPRLIEYDLPVRQTADLVDEEEFLWEIPMRPRNISTAQWETVRVWASSAEEAGSKAISIRPGHTRLPAIKVEDK